jgi:type 1 glutamine amidotransferase
MNKKLYLPFVLLLISFYTTLPVSAQDHSGKRIKVLIIDGFSNHDWQQTTSLIKAVLAPTGLFDISVSTTPPAKQSPGWDKWRPDFKNHDVVIQTFNDIRDSSFWPDVVKTDFEQYVHNGGGVYIFHGGNNAFPNWQAYTAIIGLGWRKKEQGIAVTIDSAEKIIVIPTGEGQHTGHGERTDALIHNIGNHPIHQGVPKLWRTANVEIYYYARGSMDHLQVLSYAYDESTKMNWPMEWTVEYGKGRVFNSTFGHVWEGDVQPITMRCAGVQTILVRALQWLAKQKVTYPVPNDFPTADHISVRKELVVQ